MNKDEKTPEVQDLECNCGGQCDAKKTHKSNTSMLTPIISIENIVINKMDDNDCSPNDFDCYTTEQISDWYKERWWFIGIKAECEVKYPISSQSNISSYRLEHLSSGGLWGIEDNGSTNKYLTEVAKDQLEELKEHLMVFNVDIDNFQEFADKAISEFK